MLRIAAVEHLHESLSHSALSPALSLTVSYIYRQPTTPLADHEKSDIDFSQGRPGSERQDEGIVAHDGGLGCRGARTRAREGADDKARAEPT